MFESASSPLPLTPGLVLVSYLSLTGCFFYTTSESCLFLLLCKLILALKKRVTESKQARNWIHNTNQNTSIIVTIIPSNRKCYILSTSIRWVAKISYTRHRAWHHPWVPKLASTCLMQRRSHTILITGKAFFSRQETVHRMLLTEDPSSTITWISWLHRQS